jgi:lysophospholipase L1-like esterase
VPFDNHEWSGDTGLVAGMKQRGPSTRAALIALAVVIACAVAAIVALGASSSSASIASKPSPPGLSVVGSGAEPFTVVPAPVAAAAPLHARPVRYVALGDSYSSGVGAGDYSGDSCDRSRRAFPAQWAANRPDASFAFAACAGATTASVIGTQLSSLNSSTTVVTITVGGNDVGFESVLTKCVVEGSGACNSAVNAGEAKARGSLSPQLATLYRAVTVRAPNARILVFGYPNFYDLTSTRTCPGLGGSSRTKIDEGIGVLDDVIASAARAADVEFVDSRPAFDGHEICDGTPWLHSVDITEPGASYHPTSAGQTAYLAMLNTVI